MKTTMRHVALLALVIGGMLVSWVARPWTAFSASASAQAQVQAAWQAANAVGVYHYQTTIRQTTHPLEKLINVGLSSRVEELYVEGETDRPNDFLHLQLWNGGGNVVNAQDVLEIKVEAGAAFGRLHPADDWQAVPGSTDIFAPSGDPLGYLHSVRNVQLVGAETRALAFAPDTPLTYHRYTFEVDGPAFARYMRDQMEDQLARTGSLPPGVTLELAEVYLKMTGNGEIWVDSAGRPLRQMVHLQLPPQGDEWVEAEIVTDFSQWGTPTAAATAWPLNAATLGQSLATTLDRAAEAVAAKAVSLELFGLLLVAALIFARYWRTPQLYRATAAFVIISTVFSPLLQSGQVVAFAQTQQTKQAEADAAQAEAAAARAAEAALQQTDFDPTADPLATPTAVATVEPPTPDPYNFPDTFAPVQPIGPAAPTVDSDNDGVPDDVETAIGSDRLKADTDGDTLSDGVELYKLNTNLLLADTDSDGIADNVEVAGFTSANNQRWYLDPNKVDSNGDGQPDTLECRNGTACLDTDSDGTPNVFDADNDNDAVPDQIDISPDTQMSTANNQQFGLLLDNLTPGKPTFVDLQLRPLNSKHLWYALNVLDWPDNDKQGQVQSLGGQTFGNSGRDANGDMKLIPMLEIEIPYQAGHYGNLPVKPGAPAIAPSLPITAWLDTTKTEAYGISVKKKDANGTLLVYLPVNLVRDPVGNGVVAFGAQIPYWPSANSFGPQQTVRLAWMVRVLTNACTGVANGQCWQYAPASEQMVHVYYDAWQVTGMSVREDHGVSVLMVNEQDPYKFDLWHFANGLNQTFLAGRRDLTITELQRRFDPALNGSTTATERWGLPQQAFNVMRLDLPDQPSLATIPMTYTKQFLNAYGNASQMAFGDVTVLFAREERFRTVNLEETTGTVIRGSGQVKLNLDPNLTKLQVLAGVSWAPYRQDGTNGWVAVPLDEYLTRVEGRFSGALPLAPGDTSEMQGGQVTLAKSYYLTLFQGVTAAVESGARGLTNQTPPTDSALQIVDYSAAKPISLVVKTLVDAALSGRYLHQTVANKQTPVFARANLLTRLAFRAKVDKPLRDFVSSNVKLGLGGVAATGALVGASILVWLVSDGRVSTQRALAIVTNTITVVLQAYTIYDAIDKMTKVGLLSGLAAEAAKSAGVTAGHVLASNLSKAGQVAGIIGLVVSVVAMVGVFVFSLLSGGLAFGSQAFFAAVGQLIMLILVTVLLYAIAQIPIVGQILVAIFAIVEAVIQIVCAILGRSGGICDGIIGNIASAFAAAFVPNYTPAIDLSFHGRLEIADLAIVPADPQQGLAVGAQLKVSLNVTTSLYPLRNGWGAAIGYDAPPPLAEVLATTMRYDIQTGFRGKYSLVPNNRGIEANQMNPAWRWLQNAAGEWRYRARLSPVVNTDLTHAGVNQPLPAIWLAETYAMRQRKCIAIVAYCETQTKRETLHYPINDKVVYDVFPSTLDAFYSLAADPFQRGGYRLAWTEEKALNAGEKANADLYCGRFKWNDTVLGDPANAPKCGHGDPFPVQADADGDGLRSVAKYGNDPDDSKADTDGDGLSDFYELQNGLNATATDTDGDGLRDYDEVRVGSNPRLKDTDSDGLTDNIEVTGWSFTYSGTLTTTVTADPLRADTDGDGMSDFNERVLGYHPRAPLSGGTLEFATLSVSRWIVAPGQTLAYTTGVESTFRDIIVNTRFTVAFTPAVTAPPAQGFALAFGQTRTLTGSVQVNPAITRTQVTSLSTNLYGTATGYNNTTVTVADYTQAQPILIDADKPSVALFTTPFFYPQRDRVMAFLATDPTSNLSSVEYSEGGGAWQTPSAYENSQWLYVFTAHPGNVVTYPIALRATDEVGNTSVPYGVNLQMDNTPPTAALNDYYSQRPVALQSGYTKFSGTLSDGAGSGVDTAWLELLDPSGKPISGPQLIYQRKLNETPATTWKDQQFYFPPMAQGAYTPRFRVVDGVGNEALITGTVVYVDALGPVADVTVAPTTLITTGTGAQNAALDLQLAWEETVSVTVFNDSSGHGYQAQCAGTSCPTVAQHYGFGQARQFDGVNDVVTVTIDVPETDYTLGLWFNTSCANCGLSAITAGNLGSGGADRSLYLSSGNVCARTLSDETICSTGTNYADGRWHHVAHTLGSDGQKLYLDGVPRASGTKTASNFVTQTGLTLGYTPQAATPYFNGLLSEVTVYRRALSHALVLQLAQASTLPTNPSLFYHFDEAAGATSFADASGRNLAATCSGATCPTAGGSSPFNHALQFDGVDDRLVVAGDMVNLQAKAVTLAAWVYAPPNSTGGRMPLFSRTDLTGTRGFSITLDGTGNRLLIFRDGKELSANFWQSGNVYLPTNGWFHLAITFDRAGVITVYLDGYEISRYYNYNNLPTDEPLFTSFGVNGPLYIGGAPGRPHFKGYLDEVIVYGTNLLTADRLALLNLRYPPFTDRSEVLHYTFDRPASTLGSAQADEAYADAADPIQNTNDWPQYGGNLVEGKWGRGVTYADLSTIRPKYTQRGTVAVWVKLANTTDQFILSTNISNSNYLNDAGVKLRVVNGQLRPEIWNAFGAISGNWGTVPANTWTHLAFTFEKGGLLVGYINGVEVGRTELYLNGEIRNPDAATSTTFRLGIGFDTNYVYDGLAAYGRVLSVAEINNLRQFDYVQVPPGANVPLGTPTLTGVFHDGPRSANPTLNLHFEESSTATAFNDGSANRFVATCAGAACPTPAQSSVLGQALRFDGSSDYLEIPHSTAFNVERELTVGAWVKLDDSQLNQKIIGKTNLSSGFLLGVGSGNLYPEIWDSGGGFYQAQWPGVPSNTWTHLAFTYVIGGYLIGYINGQEVGRIPAGTAPITSSLTPLRIGTSPWAPGAYFAKGLLDEVVVYNRALTPQEMRDLVTQQVVGSESLQANFYHARDNAPLVNQIPQEFTLRFKLDSVTGTTTFSDTTGLLSLRCSGGNCPQTGQPGRYVTAVRFDGVNDYLDLGPMASPNPSQNLAAGVWVKLFNPQADQVILAKSNQTSGYVLGVQNGQLYAKVWDASGALYTGSWGAVPANAWTHLGFTWASGGALIGYVNGQEVGRLNASAQAIGSNSTALRLGAAPWNAAYALGYVDDPVVYHRTLTGEEMNALAYPPAYWASTGEDLAAMVSFEEGAEIRPYTTLTKTYWMDQSPNQARAWSPLMPNTSVEGKLGYGTNAKDLILENMPIVDLNDFSVSFWAKPNNGDPCFGISTLESQAWVGFYLCSKGMWDGITQTFSFDQRLTTSTNTLTGTITTTRRNRLTGFSPAWSGWTHVVATYRQGDAVVIYQNGLEVARQDASQFFAMPFSEAGATWLVSNRNYWGQLDEFKLYRHALTADEVKQLTSDSAWQKATLTDLGDNFSTWTTNLGPTLEGPYNVALRAVDRGGATRIIPNAWRGEIDTQAPRVTLVGQVNGPYLVVSKLEVTDYNLLPLEQNFTGLLLQAGKIRPFNNDELWFQIATQGQGARLYQLSNLNPQTGRYEPFTTLRPVSDTFKVCDSYNNCASVKLTATTLTTVTVGLQPEAPLAATTPVEAAPAVPTLDGPTVALGAPSALTSTNPVAFNFYAGSPSFIRAVTVTVNGAPIYTTNWANGALTETTQATTNWTPPGQGTYTLGVQLRDWSGVVVSGLDTALLVDTTPPAVTLAVTRVTQSNYNPEEGLVTLFGAVSDNLQLVDLQGRINNGPWQPIALPVVTTTWQANLADNTLTIPDGTTAYTLAVRATDSAGWATTVSNVVPADAVPPAAFTITVSYNGTGGPTTVPAGGTIADVLAPNVTLGWTTSAGSARYRAGWTTSETPGAGSTLTPYTAGQFSHNQTLQDGQFLYPHVIAEDAVGNQTVVSFGSPVYVDYKQTPTHLTAFGTDYRGWQTNTCSLLGTDARRERKTQGLEELAFPQTLYTTWDQSGLRLTWTGANWSTDGDLFVYFDAQAGGSNRAYDPYATTSTSVLLPVERTAPLAASALPSRLALEAAPTVAFGADYLVWVQEKSYAVTNTLTISDTEFPTQTVTVEVSATQVLTASLLAWNAGTSSWEPVAGDWSYTFDPEADIPTTDIYLPFARLGIVNPASSGLSLVAFATANDALRLWSTQPSRNPLNSSAISANGSDLSRLVLTDQYHWANLGNNVCPAVVQTALGATHLTEAGTLAQYSASDVTAKLSANPVGTAYSLLNEDYAGLIQSALSEFEDLADWNAEWQALCAEDPSDPACERLITTTAHFDPANVLGLLLDTNQPLLSHNQPIVYALELTNHGTDPATGLTVEMNTWGPLVLPAGTYYSGTINTKPSEWYNLVIPVGTLAPGATQIITFTGRIQHGFDAQNSREHATLDLTIYDDTGSYFENNLDWLYLDHGVDDYAPLYLEMQSPLLLVGPQQNTLRGYVQDYAAVPTMTFRITNTLNQVNTFTCLDDTPADGQWACPWNAGNAADGSQFLIEARATDQFGQTSEWSWEFNTLYTVEVDAVPPTLQLSATTQTAFSDGLIGPAETLLQGLTQDDHLVSAVQICDATTGTEQCQTLATPSEPAQTYQLADLPVAAEPIPNCVDDTLFITYDIPQSFHIADLNLGLQLEHPYRSDIVAMITSPVGTEVNLFGGEATADNYNVWLNDATRLIINDDTQNHALTAPLYDNERSPAGFLSYFNNELATGTWTLSLCDQYPDGDNGVYRQSLLEVRAQNVAQNTSTAWDYNLSLPAEDFGGLHQLRLYAVDSVGNRSTTPLSYTYRVDSLAPIITVTSAPNQIYTPLAPPVLAGTVSDNGGIAAMYFVVQTPLSGVITNSLSLVGNSWSAYTNTTLFATNGTYLLWVEARDLAGNSRAAGPYLIRVGRQLYLPVTLRNGTLGTHSESTPGTEPAPTEPVPTVPAPTETPVVSPTPTLTPTPPDTPIPAQTDAVDPVLTTTPAPTGHRWRGRLPQ